MQAVAGTQVQVVVNRLQRRLSLDMLAQAIMLYQRQRAWGAKQTYLVMHNFPAAAKPADIPDWHVTNIKIDYLATTMNLLAYDSAFEKLSQELLAKQVAEFGSFSFAVSTAWTPVRWRQEWDEHRLVVGEDIQRVVIALQDAFNASALGQRLNTFGYLDEPIRARIAATHLPANWLRAVDWRPEVHYVGDWETAATRYLQWATLVHGVVSEAGINGDYASIVAAAKADWLAFFAVWAAEDLKYFDVTLNPVQAPPSWRARWLN